MEKVVFVLISLLTLGGAALAVWHRSVVHSAFALLATLFGMAGYFVLLGADFLAVIQVLLYVGGILVLILFGLMLTRSDLHERSYLRLGLATVLVGVILVWAGIRVSSSVRWFVRADTGVEQPVAGVASGAATEAPSEVPSSIRDVGRGFLQQDAFVVPFELASILLLVALVGAVHIGRRREDESNFEDEDI